MASFFKTDKSTAYHSLTQNLENAELPLEAETLTVIDGNVIFHAMIQVPQTFRDISIKVLDMLPKKGDIIFSTDMYKSEFVKAMEQHRKGNW